MLNVSVGTVLVILAILVAHAQSVAVLKLRHNNPPNRVYDWVALGDSYSAGPGAGAEFDPNRPSGPCMRRHEAYAPILQRDPEMIGPEGPRSWNPEFRFVSCTGDTTKNLLDFSDPVNNQLNQLNKDTTFVTLSIGGNDALFEPVLSTCVYGMVWSGVAGKCESVLAESRKILYGKDFHARYFKVLNHLITEKFNWRPETHDTSVIYHTSYMQFFDDYTEQCDSRKFWGLNPKAPSMKQDIRRTLNHVVQEMNEVLQYWIDLKNGPVTRYMNRYREMRTLVSPVHWVNVDWRYMDHRFCREGVEEPARTDPNTWFWHVPRVPPISNQENNQTYVDLVVERFPFTWQPGRPGEPQLNTNPIFQLEETPFDPEDSVHLLTDERIVRTFHPTADGFAAEADELKAALYRRKNQGKLSDKRFNILCIGDFSAFGESYDLVDPQRYGFIPYLKAELDHADNFNNRPVMNDFIGSQRTGFSGDVGHEIYPHGRWYRQIAHWAASTSEFQTSIGKVIPIMMGAKDLQNGTPVKEILNHVHWLLAEIWKFDETATVLLASAPMMGYPEDDGSEWYFAQKRVIEYNAQLAQIANYYARKDRRRIVYVHLSASQIFRIKQNPYVANTRGYQIIAHDFLNGMIQANERGFFSGDQWDASVTNIERPSYELKPLKDNEVTNGIKCHQRRGRDAPDFNIVTKSLFKGAKDQEDWIENYACKKEFICKFAWDAESPDSSAEYPFGNGKTCITTGGNNSTHTTTHQLVVRRENFDDDLGDWCKNNIREILDRCIKEGEGYGGYWGDGKRAVHLSNVVSGSPVLDEQQLITQRYRENDIKKVTSLEPQKNWRDNYPPYEQAMEWIKNGGEPQFVPDSMPDAVEPAGPHQPPQPVSYDTWQPQAVPAKGEPKSLQIIYESFTSSGAEEWQKWHFFEATPGTAVDPCSSSSFSVDNAPVYSAFDPPWINVKKTFRPKGYAQDCTFEGLNGKGPSGDVGWLHCPDRPAIMCLEDPKKSGGESAWKVCEKGDWLRDRIPVGYCDWS